MDEQRITSIFAQIPQVKVAVYGDYCLDVYWTLDPRGSEVSVETGIPAQSVSEAQYAPGGAGNIIKNMSALGAKQMVCLGITGADIFGLELKKCLSALGAQTDSLIVQDQEFSTYTYIKRYLNGFEEARIDFGVHNKRATSSEREILDKLTHHLMDVDVWVINQQVPGSMDNPSFREQLMGVISQTNTLVLIDSRHYSQYFDRVYFKINSYELAQLFGKHVRHQSEKQLEKLAIRLYERTQKPVFVTRGPKGIWVVNQKGLISIPGVELVGEIDPVGAGDTVVSTLALSLAAGASEYEAAYLANLAAAKTVKKLFQTGTANQEEVWDLYQSLAKNNS